jgi:hypothetical protein
VFLSYRIADQTYQREIVFEKKMLIFALAAPLTGTDAFGDASNANGKHHLDLKMKRAEDLNPPPSQ